MSKKKKTFITVICSILLFSSFLTLFAICFTSLFSKRNIDFDYDERLFDMAEIGSYTEYYVDSDHNARDIASYVPKPLCEIALGEKRKSWVSVNEVDPKLTEGFIAVEDREFYDHSGVNIRRTLLALLNSLFHFRDTFGASTITQQVVKNMSGDSELTLKRKLSEMIRAYNIEKNHSKSEIMELYLNIIPMGENIYGVKRAASEYFGKSTAELSAAECATLIGITNAPTRYNPRLHPEACLKKRNDVLYVMHECGVISDEDYNGAVEEKIELTNDKSEEERLQSWFIETVNSDVIADLGAKYGMSRASAEALLYNGGLKIYTTEDPSVQKTLEEYFENTHNFPDEINKGLDYAMAIVDSQSGNLLGIIGSVGKKSANKLLNLALVPRTPGSSLKPLALYAPLIDSGRITPATVFDDVPVSFDKRGGQYIEYPNNYPRVYSGLITVKDALRLSKNTVAIRLYEMLGAENIYKILKSDLGLDTLVRREVGEGGNIVTDLAPSPLALGQLSYGVSLRKLTEAYTVFPNDGVLNQGRSYIAVYDSDGKPLLENAPEGKRVFSEGGARVMNQLLMQVVKSGTASSVTLKNSVDTAGKTGTSGDDKDRLFIGYTPYLTAGIWCGYRDSSGAVGKTSVTHLQIWDDVMRIIHENILSGLDDTQIRSFSIKGLTRCSFCRDSGKLYSENCLYDPRGSRMDFSYFIPGTASEELCDRHILCRYDTLGEGIATDECPEEFIEFVSLLDIPERSFPKEIYITDAEYVWRRTVPDCVFPNDPALPFFYGELPNGEYAGRSRSKMQYNRACQSHSE